MDFYSIIHCLIGATGKFLTVGDSREKLKRLLEKIRSFRKLLAMSVKIFQSICHSVGNPCSALL